MQNSRASRRAFVVFSQNRSRSRCCTTPWCTETVIAYVANLSRVFSFEPTWNTFLLLLGSHRPDKTHSRSFYIYYMELFAAAVSRRRWPVMHNAPATVGGWWCMRRCLSVLSRGAPSIHTFDRHHARRASLIDSLLWRTWYFFYAPSVGYR